MYKIFNLLIDIFVYSSKESMSLKSKFVCNCKCFTKSDILGSIRKKGADSFVEVRTITLATTGCGRCKQEVERIVLDEITNHAVRRMQLKIDFGD